MCHRLWKSEPPVGTVGTLFTLIKNKIYVVTSYLSGRVARFASSLGTHARLGHHFKLSLNFVFFYFSNSEHFASVGYLCGFIKDEVA